MKYCGVIGYGITAETAPGVWQEQTQERRYFGDILRQYDRFQTDGKVNDNIMVSNQFSIIADPFAMEQYAYMRYIEWGGVRWKITGIEWRYPRMIISVGGVYNG